MHITMVNLHRDIWERLKRKENWNKFIREEWHITVHQKPNFIRVMHELVNSGHLVISGTETGDLNFPKAIHNFCHNLGIVCSSNQQNLRLDRVAGPGTRGEYVQDMQMYVYYNVAHETYLPPILGSMLAFSRDMEYWKNNAKHSAKNLINKYSETLEGVNNA